jgi:phosphopantothenoylcysteine decarboxylase/phosphopantothenate--cysteine ligase
VPDDPRILLTAGPTHEPIDAVRYLANRSSGRMGLALAEAAEHRSLPTTLLLGPTHLQLPDTSQTTVVRFQSTADLQRLLTEHWPNHDVLIMAAAVADYRPVAGDQSASGKLRRSEAGLTLQLEPTPDLLASLASITQPHQTTIGFALEPADRLIASATDKLQRKHLDAIVANPLETMDAEFVTATLLRSDGSATAAPANLPKREFARWLIDQALELHSARSDD